MLSSSLSLATRGYMLLAASGLFLLVNLCTIVLAKLLPLSDRPWIAAVQRDDYYCLLLPLLLPVALVGIYANWLGMKLFRHN